MTTYKNADFPTDEEGRTYHIGTKRGEIANRLLTCGDAERVQALKKFLQKILFEHKSSRGFYTVTGLYNDVPITLQASLMGYPNMDFALRESVACLDGQLVIVRFGTCGCPNPSFHIGDLAITTEARGVYRNPDAFRGANVDPYHFTIPVSGDPVVLQHLKTLEERFPGKIRVGANFSGCSFYSSQGRPSNVFKDQNENVLKLIQAIPESTSIEMETFHLFDLADISGGRVRAGGCALIIAARDSKEFVTPETKDKMVDQYGEALIKILAGIPIPNDELMKDPESVWLKK